MEITSRDFRNFFTSIIHLLFIADGLQPPTKIIEEKTFTFDLSGTVEAVDVFNFGYLEQFKKDNLTKYVAVSVVYSNPAITPLEGEIMTLAEVLNIIGLHAGNPKISFNIFGWIYDGNFTNLGICTGEGIEYDEIEDSLVIY